MTWSFSMSRWGTMPGFLRCSSVLTYNVDRSRRHGRIDFSNLEPSCFRGSPLLGAVQREQHIALLYGRAEADFDLGHASRSFRQDRHRP